VDFVPRSRPVEIKKMNGLTYSRLREIERRDERKKRLTGDAYALACCLLFAAMLALVFGT
jgi:hypothetical protein